MAVRYEQTDGDLARRSRTMIDQAVGRGTDLLADRVEHYTNLTREIGDILRDRGEPQAAELATTLAERATGMARYLRNSDGSQIIGDLQEFARGRTWLLSGVGFLGGLAIARAVRTAADGGASIAQEDYRDEYAQPYTGSTGAYSS
jgi:hypothetical protein